MAARYALDDFNGPQEGARQIARSRDAHRFYCSDCIRIKHGERPLTGEGCPVADAYEAAIIAMRALYEPREGGA